MYIIMSFMESLSQLAELSQKTREGALAITNQWEVMDQAEIEDQVAVFRVKSTFQKEKQDEEAKEGGQLCRVFWSACDNVSKVLRAAVEELGAEIKRGQAPKGHLERLLEKGLEDHTVV